MRLAAAIAAIVLAWIDFQRESAWVPENATIAPSTAAVDGSAPTLAARPAQRGSAPTRASGTPEPTGPTYVGADLLRRVYDGPLISVDAPSTTLRHALAELQQQTGIRFEWTPRAAARADTAPARRSHEVTLAFAPAVSAHSVTVADLLDQLTGGDGERLLEWDVCEDHVQIALLGEGDWLACEELLDMRSLGTRSELAAAQQTLESATAPVRRRVRRWEQRNPGAAAPRPRVDSHSRVRLEYRVLETDTELIRDLGADAPGIEYGSRLLPVACKSGMTFLDDAQCEALEKVAAKTGRLRTIDRGTLWFLAGEQRSTSLPCDGVLTVQPTPSEDRRLVHVSIRLRFLRGGLLFSPKTYVAAPSEGTLLIHPADIAMVMPEALRPMLVLLEFTAVPEPGERSTGPSDGQDG